MALVPQFVGFSRLNCGRAKARNFFRYCVLKPLSQYDVKTESTKTYRLLSQQYWYFGFNSVYVCDGEEISATVKCRAYWKMAGVKPVTSQWPGPLCMARTKFKRVTINFLHPAFQSYAKPSDESGSLKSKPNMPTFQLAYVIEEKLQLAESRSRVTKWNWLNADLVLRNW